MIARTPFLLSPPEQRTTYSERTSRQSAKNIAVGKLGFA